MVGIVLIEKSVTITNKYGLHARPAMQFVEIAGRFAADVRLVRGDKSADAKSIMEVLMLAAENGVDLLIKADGEDARQAVEALSELVASKFDEE
ncbi:MAG: HPr family phosphocarrier protein [Planctomycetota bacterium]